MPTSANLVLARLLSVPSILILASASAWAVPVEVLVNPGFEEPVQDTPGNHIGTAPTGYTATPNNDAFNLVSGSVNGNSPRSGNQFLDLAGVDGSFYQDFTLSSASSVTFGGWFQGRDGGNMGSGYTFISDSGGQVLFSSPVLVGVGAVYLPSASSGTLAAGTYRFSVSMTDPTSVDDVFVLAEAVSSVPDGGATLALLGLSMSGMAWARRKMQN